MKKNLLSTFIMLAIMAGGNALMAQWVQYNADNLPDAESTLNIRDDGSILTDPASLNAIVVDADDATNSLWKIDINKDLADNIGYNWYETGYDPDGTESPTPSPSTLACKFKWLDANRQFGPDIEIRETYKVQTKVLNDAGVFKLEVKDWSKDSVYNLPGNFDPTIWHVLRLTVNNGTWNVYIDENPTAFASGSAGKKVDKNLAMFGAWAESGKAGFLIDWMGFLETQALSPTDMPLPAGIFEASTSVRPAQNQSFFTIFPNPASNEFTLKIDQNLVNSNYEVVDITGKLIARGYINSESSKIDISRLKSGLYMMKLISKDNVLSKSFIVK